MALPDFPAWEEITWLCFFHPSASLQSFVEQPFMGHRRAGCPPKRAVASGRLDWEAEGDTFLEGDRENCVWSETYLICSP